MELIIILVVAGAVVAAFAVVVLAAVLLRLPVLMPEDVMGLNQPVARRRRGRHRASDNVASAGGDR